MTRSFFILFLGHLTAIALGQKTEGRFRLVPHHYFGARGTEPSDQLNVLTRLEVDEAKSKYPYRVAAHADFETLGRKDSSIEIDRAWISAKFLGTRFAVGRIHPYDVSHNPEANRPWGLLAQNQAQSRSILLGSPFSAKAFPSPVVLGWIGAHFWSDATREKPFQFGFSAAPLFIPSSGSAVVYGEPGESRAGRFGRRPPALVEINGVRYPIRYHLDTSDISKEIFQPQLMAQAYYQTKQPDLHWESWLSLSRSPSVDPEIESKNRLDIRETDPVVDATIKPHFLKTWSLGFTQRLRPVLLFPKTAFFFSVEVNERRKVGAEIGVDTPYFSASFLDERTIGKGALQDFSFEDPPYAQRLLQVEGRLPTRLLTYYAGVKYHLLQQGYWLTGGVQAAVSKTIDVDIGATAFGGGNGSYFGEWRSNNRIDLGFAWRFGT